MPDRPRPPGMLSTDRLLLRRPTAEDALRWVAVHRDPRLWTHAPHAMPTDDGAAEEQFALVLAGWAETGWHYMIAEDASNGERVGVGGHRRHAKDLPGEPASTVFAGPRSERVDHIDDELRAQILDLWCRVTDVDGADGFCPGAARRDVEAALAGHEHEMAKSRSFLVTLCAPDGRLRGLGSWTRSANPLLGHRLQASCVLIEPARRGRNLGRLLMAGLHRHARDDLTH